MIKGTLIKESLSDDKILDFVEIDKVELWKAENHTASQPKYWTAILFHANSEEFLDVLPNYLADGWYVDLSNHEEKIIVFKNKVVKYQIGEAAGKQEAIDYCRKIGVPESQIDWPE